MALIALARTTFFALLLLFAITTPLHPQNPEYDEPILGRIIRELPASQTQETLNGSIGFYEILKLNIYEAQIYQTIELNLQAENDKLEEIAPVSLVVYSDVKEQNLQTSQNRDTIEDTNQTLLSGNRLLTKGLIKKNKAQILLELSGQTTEEKPSPSNSLDLPLQKKDFPLYIVLYPFQKPQTEDSEQKTRYHYNIRFIKKNYGFVRFRLLPAEQNHNYNPHSALSIQIDDQSYAWEDQAQQNQQRYTREPPIPANLKYRISQAYKIPTGQHNVQVSNLKYYARNQFQIEPGELATIDLQLGERLSQLIVIVPKGAAILLDGIPLKGSHQKQRHTPIWQNVEMIELESFQHAIPRLKYKLTLPVGNHHLLLQYENKTWQREIYLEQGTEQVFQLSWQLSGRLSQ